MNIAILGSGMIGATMARLLVGAGHEVRVSNRRGAESVAGLVGELGGKAAWATGEEAAEWGEMVVLAVPFRAPEALPSVGAVAGKIVIDAMNPYAEGGGMVDLGESTSSEETVKRLPGARVVKAFNTIYFKHLATQGRKDLPEEERRAIFVASDDAEAKGVVMGLVRELGFAAVDMGGLREGGKAQEPGTAVYNRELTGAEARVVLGR